MFSSCFWQGCVYEAKKVNKYYDVSFGDREAYSQVILKCKKCGDLSKKDIIGHLVTLEDLQ